MTYPLYLTAQGTGTTTPTDSVEIAADVATSTVATTTPEVDLYSLTVEELIIELATKHGVSVSLALNIACSESGFKYWVKNPNSSAGGVFQFIDGTWRAYSTIYWGEVREKYDRVQNVELAIMILRDYGTRDWNASKHYWSTSLYEAGKCS